MALWRIPNAGSHSCSRTRFGRLCLGGEVIAYMRIIGCGGKFIAMQRGYSEHAIDGITEEVKTTLAATAG